MSLHRLLPRTLLALAATGALLAASLPEAWAAQPAPVPAAASRDAAIRIDVLPDEGPSAARQAGAVRGLAAAQAAVRAEIAKMKPGARRRIEVVLAPGEYELDKGLQFGPQDSGAEGAPVVWMAEKPDTVVISGGIRLQGESRGRGEPVVFRSDRLDPAAWAAAPQFYVGSARAVLAREPEAGNYWFVRGAVPQPGESDKLKGTSAFNAWGDAAAWIASLSPEDQRRAVVEVMQSWTASMHRIDGPVQGGTIRVSPHAIWPFLSKGSNQRFFVENVGKALDSPGEWFGSGREIRYIPRGDDGGRGLTGHLARVEHLLAIAGDGQARVQDLQFRNLNFEYAAYLTPAQPYQDNQAASQVGAAVEVDHARNVVFESCGFGHTGAYGLWFRDDVRDSSVMRSDFYDLGAGGVKVGLAKQGGDGPTQTGNITVAGNHIHDTGLVHPGAVGIWVGQSFDDKVLHNAIARTTYTGISVGWTWGYAPATSGRNKVIGNLLYDIGRGQLADMGAIYTLGVSPGTEIANNVIREVRAYEGYGYGAFGLYNDQGTSGVSMHDNVVVGTDSGAYYLHFGHDNQLRGNFFARGRAAEVRVSKPDDDTNLQVADNVIEPEGKQPFDGNFPPRSVKFAANALSGDAAGARPDAGPCAAACQDRRIDIRGGNDVKDLRIAGADGPATERFQRIVRDAGPADANVRRSLSPLPPQPTPPAVPLALPIEKTEPGRQPEGLRYTPANDLAAVHVAQVAGSPEGGKCLQFNDGTRFAHRSEPGAYALLNHREGRTTESFDILYDANTEFINEWRDDGRPFLAGPSITITAEGVKAAGRVVARPRPGQWLHVAISAELGRKADGKWSLELTPQGGKPQRIDNLPVTAKGWSRLSWLGFISNAQGETSLCLADVQVSNAP